MLQPQLTPQPGVPGVLQASLQASLCFRDPSPWGSQAALPAPPWRNTMPSTDSDSALRIKGWDVGLRLDQSFPGSKSVAE